MTLYRCFAWNPSARADAVDGPLWFPTMYQGEGRHDNPEIYGCLYLSDRPVSCVVEQLAPFRGQRLTASLLRRRGLPLALAHIELADEASIVDLDDPATLKREKLRPSRVATRQRDVTQPSALDLFRRYPEAAGLRWWSAWEALWANLTIFDRAAGALKLLAVRELTLADATVGDAAEVFGMRTT